MTSHAEISAPRAARPGTQWATALEVLLVYAGILLYIWRWQFTYPRTWIPLLSVVLASHIAHRDTLHDLGLTWRNLRASAAVVLPLAVALYVPLVVCGFASRSLVISVPGERILRMFATYGIWCFFQQYLTQSYFHRRLTPLVGDLHLRSAVVGLMFGSAHIPNPVLMVATMLGGFLFAEVFARHRNIWPLALAQAVGGFLIAALLPDSLLHHMRVGPGYFFYRVP